MTRKSLWAVAVGVLLAVTTQAGEIRYQEWPCNPAPQEVTTVPVWLELPGWVQIAPRGEIRLTRDSATEYSGCIEVEVRTNTSVHITTEFISAGVVPGTFSSSISSPLIRSSQSTIDICVRLQTDRMLAPMKNVRVGVVLIRVSPVP